MIQSLQNLLSGALYKPWTMLSDGLSEYLLNQPLMNKYISKFFIFEVLMLIFSLHINEGNMG